MNFRNRKKKIVTEGDSAGNKKVKNATKIVADGIKWDSKLEYYLYGLLKQHGFTPVIKTKYILQKSFRFQGKLIREITWSPDFILNDIKVIVDAKGYSNETFPLKFKLFLYKLADWNMSEYQMFFPKSQTECREIITKLIDLRETSKSNKATLESFFGNKR